jgi:hypothetical protein
MNATKTKIHDKIDWITKSRGWHWVGPDGWEVIRDVRHDDGSTPYIIWHNNEAIDYRATVAAAKLAAESEMTREALPPHGQPLVDAPR